MPSYFETKFITVIQIEQILWKCEDPKIVKISNRSLWQTFIKELT